MQSIDDTLGPSYYSGNGTTFTVQGVSGSESGSGMGDEMGSAGGTMSTGGSSGFPGKPLIIPLYAIIFLLSLVGNLLVILTLARNRRMVTVTNVFLLNLAISDLLLGFFCMPTTLVGQLLQNFIFGSLMCKIIPYFQAVSVSVGVWTLVAISIERYFAICRPLHSRKWQTKSHAYKIIIFLWIIALTLNFPIILVSTLKPIGETERSKCRESWPSFETEKVFNLTLGTLLLVLPLGIMVFSYSLIVSKLWKGLKTDRNSRAPPSNYLPCSENSMEFSSQSQSAHSFQIPATSGGVGGGRSNEIIMLKGGKGMVVRWKRKPDPAHPPDPGDGPKSLTPPTTNFLQLKHTRGMVRLNKIPSPLAAASPNTRQGLKLSRAIRSSYTEKSIESKKKVIRMLFVLVAEFFICWTPLYVMHLWYLFDAEAVYKVIGPLGVVLIQLLAYSSSCSNPITYCFMNRRFRFAFLKLLQSIQRPKKKFRAVPTLIERPSDLSANGSLLFAVQGSTLNKSGK